MLEKKEKFDFKKEFKYLFRPSAKRAQIVDVPAMKTIQIRGEGYPGTSPAFQDKIEVLYGLSYTIKFMLKQDKNDPFDYTVGPFSGLWYADDIAAYKNEERRNEWKWTLMILQPDQVTIEVFEKGKALFKKKKNPALLEEASFSIFQEGLSAQIMHIGPYDQEGPTIKKLHDFIKDEGYTFNGHHHEIYLGNPQKSKPEKLKTILRHPIKKIN